MSRHSDEKQLIHTLVGDNAVYADITARDADTAFQVTANLNKMVRVNSPISYFILAALGPTVWRASSPSTGVTHIGGNFVDTTDQTIASVSVGQSVTFNKNSLIEGISHSITVNTDVFTIDVDGVYKLTIAPQLAQGSGGATVEFWIKKNDISIPDTGVQVTIAANSQSLPFFRWKERFVATDTIKIIWASNSLNSMLDNITSTYGGPNIPSIMLGITKVGN